MQTAIAEVLESERPEMMRCFHPDTYEATRKILLEQQEEAAPHAIAAVQSRTHHIVSAIHHENAAQAKSLLSNHAGLDSSLEKALGEFVNERNSRSGVRELLSDPGHAPQPFVELARAYAARATSDELLQVLSARRWSDDAVTQELRRAFIRNASVRDCISFLESHQGDAFTKELVVQRILAVGTPRQLLKAFLCTYYNDTGIAFASAICQKATGKEILYALQSYPGTSPNFERMFAVALCQKGSSEQKQKALLFCEKSERATALRILQHGSSINENNADVAWTLRYVREAIAEISSLDKKAIFRITRTPKKNASK